MRVVQAQNLKDMEEFQAVLEGFVLKYLWNEMYSNYVTWIRTFKKKKKTKVLTVKGKRLSTKIDNIPEITCNGSLLTNVMNVKLLGLEIDEELSFSEHITTVCKKVSQRIGLLKKIMNYLPLKQRLLYYNALIRPVINYASVLWTNCDKESLRRVLKLQKRAARVI